MAKMNLKKLLSKVPKVLKINKKMKDMSSCVLCMLLVILVSQSRVLDFLMDTNLGRTALLGLLLTICCTNKIFGVASVLFLVLAIAVHMNTREGMQELEQTEEICEECKDKPKDCKCPEKKKEGMCGKKKEGMCGKKKGPEGFNLMSAKDRLSQELDLLRGKQPYKEVVKRGKTCGAKPHDNLETEFGSLLK